MNKIKPVEARSQFGYRDNPWLAWSLEHDEAVVGINLIRAYRLEEIFEAMQEKINELVQECNELRGIIESNGLSSAENTDAKEGGNK